MIDLKDLRLVMLPLKQPRPDHKHQYDLALHCWQEVWLKVNQNFGITQPLFSDNFSRQDEGATIFQGDRCVGMILFRTLDFSVFDYRADSYFKEWTDSDLETLFKHGNRAFLSNFLTVHPDFRAFSSEFKFKEVFLDLMIRRFLESDASVIAGITRRDRAINDESLKLGAQLIRENADFFGGREKVDLVAFYRHQAKISENPAVRKLNNRLWAERLDLTYGEVRHLNAA